MNEYRKRIADLKVGDSVVVRPFSGGKWYPATVTSIGDRWVSKRQRMDGPFIAAGGLSFSDYGSVQCYETGRTSGCRCIVPLNMWLDGTWKPGALPPEPPKPPAPCIECKRAKTSMFSPRCPECRIRHEAKKKQEYKQNRKRREACLMSDAILTPHS